MATNQTHQKAEAKADAKEAKADAKAAREAKVAELELFNEAQLRKMAYDKGIDVPADAKKDDIINALIEAQPLALTGPVIPLPLADIVADAYGIGKKYNIALSDIVGIGTNLQGNFLLDNLPAGSIVQLVRVKHSQSVAGGGIATCTAQVGDGTNLWGAALDVFGAPGNAALNTAQLTANNIGPFAAVYPVYLTLIATVGNLGGATSGAISAWLRYTPMA